MALGPAFFRSMESLHRAGIPWLEAVTMAGGSGMTAVRERLHGGDSLADALRDRLEPLDYAVIRAGESSGRLEGTFGHLAARHEEEARRRREASRALVYPLFIAHLAAFLLAVLDLIQGNPGGLVWTAVMLAIIWGGRWLVGRSQATVRDGDPTRARRTTFFNRSQVEDADGRALRALADTHDAGLPFVEALELAAEAGAGGRVCADFSAAALGARKGEALGDHLQHTPPDVQTALQVAERSGDLAKTARRAADDLAASAETRRHRWRTVLPPLLYLAIALVIAAKVIGFYSDYFGRIRALG